MLLVENFLSLWGESRYTHEIVDEVNLSGQMTSQSPKETYDSLIRSFEARQKITLDQVDLRILNALQTNNRLTNIELAQLVRLSAPTCLRRVRRLREEGVITGDVSVVDRNKLGDYLTLVVSVYLREEAAGTMAQLERYFRAMPEVTQCYLVTGDADYVLVVVARSMDDYAQFAQEVLYAHPSIMRFTTMAVMKNVKFSIGVPLEVAEA